MRRSRLRPCCHGLRLSVLHLPPALLHDPQGSRCGLPGLCIYVKTRLSWNSAAGPRLASSTCWTVARPDSLCP